MGPWVYRGGFLAEFRVSNRGHGFRVTWVHRGHGFIGVDCWPNSWSVAFHSTLCCMLCVDELVLGQFLRFLYADEGGSDDADMMSPINVDVCTERLIVRTGGHYLLRGHQLLFRVVL